MGTAGWVSVTCEGTYVLSNGPAIRPVAMMVAVAVKQHSHGNYEYTRIDTSFPAPIDSDFTMLLQKEIVTHLAKKIVAGLAPGFVEIANTSSATTVVDEVIVQELSVEDELNDEVREILSQYSDYMRREQVSYQDMFRKVKNQLVAERKIVRASGRDTGDGMKLSRDKITEISHKVLTAMRKGRDFRLKRPENDIRLQIVKTFTEFLQAEDKLDKAARQKIKSQKREILENSEEYDLLLRRYYAEELKKLGIDLPRP